jgi:hypothetical protein
VEREEDEARTRRSMLDREREEVRWAVDDKAVPTLTEAACDGRSWMESNGVNPSS